MNEEKIKTLRDKDGKITGFEMKTSDAQKLLNNLIKKGKVTKIETKSGKTVDLKGDSSR